MPSHQTQAEALVVLTWNQESVMLSDSVKNAIDRPICDKQEIRNNLQNVFDSMEHLTYIMARLEEQTEKFVLLESSVDLLGLIKKAIEMQKIYLDQKTIKVVENYIDSSLYVYCDQVHMLEVINNIIKNAGEAITSDNGIIELGLYAYKKNLVIEIKDNGVGITKENIQYVFDPFFLRKDCQKILD